jgi:putative inorganic carbon (HCO3(-)) transporter
VDPAISRGQGEDQREAEEKDEGRERNKVVDMERKAGSRETGRDPGQVRFRPPSLVTRKHIAYTFLVILALSLAMFLALPAPYNWIPLLSLLGILVVFLIIKYPITGLFIYLLIFFVKPNELFPLARAITFPYEKIVAIIVIVRLAAQIAFVEKRLRIRPLDYTVIAFLAAVFFSILGAVDIASARTDFDIFTKIILTYFMIVLIVRREGEFKAIIWLYILSTAFLAFYSTWHYYGGDYLEAQGIIRAYIPGGGSYSDPNSLATTLVLGVPFMIMAFRYHRAIILRLLLVSMLAVSAWNIILTGSRGGMLGLISVLFLVGFFSRRRAATLMLSLAAVVVLAAVAPEQYVERFETISEYNQDDTTGAGASARGRIEGLIYGVKFFFERPITGIGMANFPYYFFMEGKGWFNPHNMLAQLISELGMVGFLAFSFFIYYVFRSLRRAKRLYLFHRWNDRFIPLMVSAVQIGFIMLFFQGLFGHNLYRFNWYIFASFVAITGSLVSRRAVEASVEQAHVSEDKEEENVVSKEGKAGF